MPVNIHRYTAIETYVYIHISNLYTHIKTYIYVHTQMYINKFIYEKTMSAKGIQLSKADSSKRMKTCKETHDSVC